MGYLSCGTSYRAINPVYLQARVNGFVVGVAPKVAGLITQVGVVNNAEVEAGDVLFQIDSADYDIALDRAMSELDKSRKQVQAGDAGVDAARAQLAAAG